MSSHMAREFFLAARVVANLQNSVYLLTCLLTCRMAAPDLRDGLLDLLTLVQEQSEKQTHLLNSLVVTVK